MRLKHWNFEMCSNNLLLKMEIIHDPNLWITPALSKSMILEYLQNFPLSHTEISHCL